MAKFRGKKGEFHLHPGTLAWVVEPAAGGLWCLVTLFLMGGTFQVEVEGTVDTTARALQAEQRRLELVPAKDSAGRA